MNTISGGGWSSVYTARNQKAQSNAASGSNAAAVTRSAEKTQISETPYVDKSAQASEKSNYGKTIGTPKLSKEAEKYYKELKKKFGDMDFVLVSEDMKDQAQDIAGGFAKTDKTIVLINTEKIEQMATDENYRKKFEGIISDARTQLDQLQTSLGSTGASVSSYGMQVEDDGTTSFFAVVDKSLTAQRDRIRKQADQKAQAKKETEKQAEEKRTEKKAAEKAGSKTQDKDSKRTEKSDDQITITASSIEELLQKIQNTVYNDLSNRVRTEDELKIGQHVDFKG